MKWFRRKKKPGKELSDKPSLVRSYTNRADRRHHAAYATPRGSIINKLPDKVLERIFILVCPHSQDETYETCEQSSLDDCCPLCDTRDLAHCAQVSRKWRNVAIGVLYHSVRIDAVHFCELEEILSEKRKHKGRFNRNAEPEETPNVRLQLLCRTIRDNRMLGELVEFLKTPYMTRGACKADLARSVAVCPNMRYLDLPEGIFSDDPSCHTLKLEIQARCPDLRKMTYMTGSERSLEQLAGGKIWKKLEVLEFTRLDMDPTIIRRALGSLTGLRALKVTDTKTFNDEVFQHSDYLPPFPAFTELVFENTPNVTAIGLEAYLFRSDTQEKLTNLSLTETGIHPSTLHKITDNAPRLTFLSIVESVHASFTALHNIPPLSSMSLQTLHYEITSASSAITFKSVVQSHYSYLTTSLISNRLPALRALYVRDSEFPESLIGLAPPAPAYASDPDNFVPPNPFDRSSNAPSAMFNNRFSSNNPFAAQASLSPAMPAGMGLKQELEVYTKGLDEMEWNFAKVQPPTAPGRRGSATTARPISSYGLGDSMGKAWAPGHGARRSVIVGNGFGGFLAVPADDPPRPSSSAGEKKRHSRKNSSQDLWR
ncbi:putative f-box domain protein [Botrytis fragariae]|uniref:Putative f-box domain protein n=1 Tax=Botrytis fragariae TaxID=1964551 RepID=A0A8H6EFZ7_9HELO|nr:putative f-box domain protein [Botrytis fragariae]KAF5870929.1 putative f-box domain protein [Botrytis fragariae]